MKKQIPTEEQIENEIKTLREMKPNVLRFSGFGDDHHAAIDAQIKVLERRWSSNEVYDRYEECDDNIRRSAEEAAYWMEGYAEDGSPSEGWRSLVR